VVDGPLPYWATPTYIGPTWQRDETGQFILPRRTLGWHAVAWMAENLKHGNGKSWRYSPEQLRLTLWWYALELDDDEFLHREAVIQRLKGWGKDPVLATWSANEFVGPSQPDPAGRTVLDPWGNEHPAGIAHPEAWVQLAAVSKDQTRNTMTLFPSLFKPSAIERYAIDIGKEIIYANRGAARIEAVTSSPRSLEGGRTTFVGMNETHHWLANNEGHEMAAAIERNATKVDGRVVAVTNAFEPSEDSHAQRTRETWEDQQSGAAELTGLMYDSVEAHPDAPLTKEAAPIVLEGVRGDSVWLKIPNLVKSILNGRTPPSRSRRFWYNQVGASEDAWTSPLQFESCKADDDIPPLALGDEVVLFVDCSKNDDATGLVACRMSDGLVHVLGMLQRPKGDAGKGWTTPRSVVDDWVVDAMERYNVRAFFGDPSHVLDDETQERYWDGLFDEWHRRYKDALELWAVPGRQGHAVMWDMTSQVRSQAFTAAAERTAKDIEDMDLVWWPDGRLRSHVRNAKRYPNKWGVSLWKGHRESARKIDLAVCMVGARMVRRLVMNNPNRKRQRSGEVW
jgi:hypothetical protein